jgi:DNA-binding NtrC family response regulator
MAETARHPILIVDDEPEILYSLRGLLRKEFDVQTAQSAYEGLHVLRRQPIHVVMTDQRMPQTTGVEFLRQVRTEFPDVIRLILTGYADLKAVIAAINHGCVYRYLTKPWDPDELRAVLLQASAEYDHVAERRRLLADLNGQVARWRQVVDGLRSGALGTLTPEGQAELERLDSNGPSVLRRLEEILGPGGSANPTSGTSTAPPG